MTMDRFTKEELEEIAHALRLNVSRIIEKMLEYESRYLEGNITDTDTFIYEQQKGRMKMLRDLIHKVEDYINQEE